MNRLIASTATLILLTSSAGCGTILNMRDSDKGPTPLGGVERKFAHFVECTKIRPDDVHGMIIPGSGLVRSVVGFAFTIVDFPLTVVGDIVTLPWILRAGPKEQPSSNNPESASFSVDTP